MTYEDPHVSDQQLLLNLDGELSTRDEKRVRAHLDACWTCRVRLHELESAIADFVHGRQRELHDKLPPVAGARALLTANLSAIGPVRRRNWLPWAMTAAACALLGVSLFRTQSPVHFAVVSIPDSRLTPGATLLEGRRTVCAESKTNNKTVSAALQRKVFEEYGIAGAEPQAYEIDYLVTPALGGADDLQNLWPHSYSSTAWNARVKDELENRLHEMVCDGRLDLAQAQHEIASNWIAAYKKYFHTDKPLAGQTH